MRLSLAILYTPTADKPLRIANITDPALLVEAAVTAIAEAETRAERLAGTDCELCQVERAEADRLKAILGNLLFNDPQARESEKEPVPVM